MSHNVKRKILIFYVGEKSSQPQKPTEDEGEEVVKMDWKLF
jgi:hypothetical protein